MIRMNFRTLLAASMLSHEIKSNCTTGTWLVTSAPQMVIAATLSDMQPARQATPVSSIEPFYTKYNNRIEALKL